MLRWNSKSKVAFALFGLAAAFSMGGLAAQENSVVFENDFYLPNVPSSANGSPVCIEGDGRIVANCDASGGLTSFDQFNNLPCTAFDGSAGTIEIVHGVGNAIGFRCIPDDALCDYGIALNDTDPDHAALAIDLCETTTSGSGSGVISASYVRANGTPASPALQVGITPLFGANVTPRAGDRMLMLSSGHARDADDLDFCGNDSCAVTGLGTAPLGFPADIPGCSPLDNIYDDVGLELTLRAPADAMGFAFDFSFYTFDYPNGICGAYNDQTIVLMSPPISADGNISFDAQGSPITVNLGLDVCDGCALGTADLVGTGFDAAGATGWLTTTAPISGSEEFTLRFVIFDTGDQAIDSTILIDNFRWLTEETTLGTAPASP